MIMIRISDLGSLILIRIIPKERTLRLIDDLAHVCHMARKRLHQLEEMSWTLHKEGNVEPPYPPELILQVISEAQYKRKQHFWPTTFSQCWMLHVVFVCTPCCMLLRVVGGCCVTFRTGQKADLATERERQLRRRAQIKQLEWPIAERQIEHRKSRLVLSARFPVVDWRSRSVAKSALTFSYDDQCWELLRPFAPAVHRHFSDLWGI